MATRGNIIRSAPKLSTLTRANVGKVPPGYELSTLTRANVGKVPPGYERIRSVLTGPRKGTPLYKLRKKKPKKKMKQVLSEEDLLLPAHQRSVARSLLGST